MAKERACSTSRLAIRRVFSCSARERSRLSLRSLIWFSSSASLLASGEDGAAAESSVGGAASVVSSGVVSVSASEGAAGSAFASDFVLNLRGCSALKLCDATGANDLADWVDTMFDERHRADVVVSSLANSRAKRRLLGRSAISD